VKGKSYNVYMRKLSKGEGIAVGVAVVLVFGLFFGGAALLNFFTPSNDSLSYEDNDNGLGGMLNEPTPTPTPLPTNQPKPTMTQPQGLQINDTKIGTGAEAVAGKTITVHYTGTFTNGQKFDSSRDRGQPFSFVLGAGQVIAGWEQGFAGMKVGGTRKIVVPPELGYGPNDYYTIPGNSTLLFDVELLDVK